MPGKVPLYLEGENPETASETAANVGVEISAGEARLAFIPGAAAVTAAMMERIARADVVLFDGTLFRDDEMIASGTGSQDRPPHGAHADRRAGRLACRTRRSCRPAHLCPHQQYQSDPDRRLARARASRAQGLGNRRGRDGDRAVKLITPQELEAQLRDIGARRYHRLHPFHALLHGGKCTKGQVQAWALNRYYYQAMIPVKDASLIARCDDPALRREWRSRLIDHDGESEGDGGIARWLKLTDGLGLDRDYVVSLARAAARRPASRSRPTSISCARRPCSRRSPPRSPNCSRRRSSASGSRACSRATTSSAPIRSPISPSARRWPSAIPTSRSTTSSATPRRRTQQQAVLNALEFKCDVLWAMLDALYHAYVAPKHVPPGAFVPKDVAHAQ